MIRSILRAACLAGILGLAAASPAAANCGAEGCPLNPQGLETSARRWSFDLGYQHVDQDVRWDGTSETTEPEPVGHITELYTKTGTWTLSGRAQIRRSFLLSAMLPYIQREHSHADQLHLGHFITSTWKYEGLGDATLLAQWTALGSPWSGAGALMLQGGVKLPTGKTEVQEVNGEQPEAPARPGTGSTDWLAGLQLMRHWRVPAPQGRETTLPLLVSALARWNGAGTDDYRVGNDVHASLSSNYAVLRNLSLLAQLNAVFHGGDDVGNTDAVAHETGGASVFVTPGLSYSLPAGASLYGIWQGRVYQRTNGPQLVAPSHWIVGASLGLGR